MAEESKNNNTNINNKPKGNSLRKAIAWIAGVVFSIAIILPCLLYIPFVQDGVKNAVTYFVNCNTDMKMDVGRIMLKFPLKISIDDVLILDASQDTMLCADKLETEVKILPIFRKKVEIQSFLLKNALYKMSSEDGSMDLRAEIDQFRLRRSEILLDKNEINLKSIGLKGGRVQMKLGESTPTEEPVDTSSIPWLMNIGRVKIEDFACNMQMLPLIENLNARVGQAVMSRTMVNLATNDVKIGHLGVDYADVKYLYPVVADSVAEPTVQTTVEPEATTKDWTINVDSVRLNGAHAVYAMSGAIPVKGLDMNYLELRDINIAIDSVYNKGSEIKLDLLSLTARERSGLEVKSGRGAFSVDSKLMKAEDVKLETAHSELSLEAVVGTDVAEDVSAPIKVDARAKFGFNDAKLLYPSLSSLVDKMPYNVPLEMNVLVDGTTRRIDVKEAKLGMRQYISVEADGYAENVMDSEKLNAKIDFLGKFRNLNFVEQIVLTDSAMQSQIDMLNMILKGGAQYAQNEARGGAELRLSSGEMVFSGDWNGNRESYEADLALDSFPVISILPLSELKEITANAKVKGVGYDPFNPKTTIDASLRIDKLSYGNKIYRDVEAVASVADQNAKVELKSKNADCNMDMGVVCRLDTADYEFIVDGTIDNVDLKALKLSETTCRGKGKIVAFGKANVAKNLYDVDMSLRDFKWVLPDATYSTDEFNALFVSSEDHIMLSAKEEDMMVDFNASCGIDTLLACLERSMKIVEYEIAAKNLDLDTLQNALPHFSCDLKVGEQNLLKQALKSYDVKVKDLALNIVNDSTIYMNGHALGVESGTMRLDTVSVYANQRNKYLTYKLHVGNEKGTNDEFAQVTLKGGVRGSMLGMLLEQHNIKGEQGFRFGVNARLSDTAVNVNIFPKVPIIGYRKWDVNDGNSVNYNYIKKQFEADLHLRSDSSFIMVRTEDKQGREGQDDVKLSLGGVQIAEWLKVSPFIPPMSGELSADIKLILDRKNILGGGVTRMKDFKFNRKEVGDFAFKLGLELDPDKHFVRLISSFDVNGRRAVVARGSLNDTTSQNPYNILVKLDSFPMNVVNPFVPGDMVKLDGALNGAMNITGSLTEPSINGYVLGHDAAISLPLFGSHLKLDDDTIPVDSNVVRFNKYNIYGSNNNAIAVDGYVNLTPMNEMPMDLTLKGKNVEFVNSKQQRKMELFGKGYATVDAKVKGTMNDMNVDASLSLLPATNLTYVMQTDVSALSTQTDENMVKFVSFADTAKAEVDSLTNLELTKSNFKLNAKLNIQQGSKFSVYLSNSGNDRVELSGSGILNYSQSSLGDMRLVGRYTLKDGFARYTPPLLSEKKFDFVEGSYISWNGDVLNPELNISAVDEMKANVQHEGQESRMIDFLVTMSIGNTLNNMDMNFDLSTKEDVTVKNELLSMSPSQRSSQAINMLLYGTYTGLGTTANMNGNPLYSFLNSQINRWAANTIKGVDLTFGVNQFDNGSGDEKSKSTTYSYKISKSLFNDRFKIVVGGNYSPGGDTEDSFANSLLNDISFVYMLNQSGTMSVKLFRHTGYESVLEGEVTEMGGAFVIKRKLSTLKNLFRFRPRKNTAKKDDAAVKDTTIRLEESPVVQPKKD